MRILFAVPLLALAACNVENDPANDQVTIQYNEEQAQNVAEDVGNTAQGIGQAIANEADETVDKLQNTDVDVDVDTNTADNRQ
ncbi:MAG TPA: hypothetical protein VFO51_02930 [Sphingomicrobium sp.]|nr:hypothetical protein [Sphingomicrobium sp.]